MNKRTLSATLCIALMMCACDGTLSARELAALAHEGSNLNDTTVGFGPIPPSRWPAAISKLQPERVYRTPAGLYIATDSFFVQERGLFIPDPATRFLPGDGSDPSYEILGEGIFAYAIKG